MRDILIGIAIALCIAAGAIKADVLTVKPAEPKVCLVKYFEGHDDSEMAAKFIKDKMSKGWILKAVSGADYTNTSSAWIVVMEKY